MMSLRLQKREWLPWTMLTKSQTTPVDHVESVVHPTPIAMHRVHAGNKIRGQQTCAIKGQTANTSDFASHAVYCGYATLWV